MYVIVCDLETSRMKLPRFELGCCVVVFEVSAVLLMTNWTSVMKRGID